MTFRFADCILDTSARSLLREGRPAARLTPKSFELLALLVEHRPRALPKEELLERVWPGVFVSDASLAKVVSKLRQAIGDDAASPIIRTVHGYGYAFAAAIEGRDEAAPLPRPRPDNVLAVLRRARVSATGRRSHRGPRP